jgi:hypothetical protein
MLTDMSYLQAPERRLEFWPLQQLSRRRVTVASANSTAVLARNYEGPWRRVVVQRLKPWI